VREGRLQGEGGETAGSRTMLTKVVKGRRLASTLESRVAKQRQSWQGGQGAGQVGYCRPEKGRILAA
jgi:hypothetical protein